MKRRDFISASLLGGFVSVKAFSEETDSNIREFYEIRKYHIFPGLQSDKNKRFNAFLADVALPAFNRIGLSHVGAFIPHHGSNTRELFVILPHKSLESVVCLNDRLLADSTFTSDGKDVLNTSQSDPAHLGIESSLLIAFEKMPRLRIPRLTTEGKRRIFNLRTYEGHSVKASKKKIEMFNYGSEIEIFLKVGMEPVLFGETLIGPKMPSLTYMMAYENYKALEEKSKEFWNDSEWVELRNKPEYKDIVSNYNSLMLRPTTYSQI